MRHASTSLTGRLIDQAIGKADRFLRSLLRAREARRADRLYGPLPRREMPAPLGYTGQATALSGIVRGFCATGDEVVATHASAALKIDSAEYAFSSMLEELRGVMKSMPTDWAPERRAWPAGNIIALPESREARAA